jgi:DNA-binding transcriptional regulator GbsR (MarR family)
MKKHKNTQINKAKASERVTLLLLENEDLTIPQIVEKSSFCLCTISKLVKQLQDEKKISYREERKKGRRVFYKL